MTTVFVVIERYKTESIVSVFDSIDKARNYKYSCEAEYSHVDGVTYEIEEWDVE